MSFAELMNDNVELRKSDGTKVAGLKASVQRGTRIYMDAGKLVIEPGDVILRKLSTGVEERYRVIDPRFYEAFEDIAANYQMRVQRLEGTSMSGEDEISEERRQALFKQWEDLGVDFVKHDLMNGGYRFVGGPPATRKLAREWVRMKEADQAKGNYNIHVSGPNSRVNLHSTDQSINTAVEGRVQNNEELQRLKKLLDDLAAAKDKKTFGTAYQAFIASAADHITIITPFLPSLTDMLRGLG